MRQRTLTIDIDAALADALARAIAAYARAAFPDGGSACAQVSREALLDTAHGCELHQGGELVLRRRQHAQLRAALRWYFAEHPQEAPETVSALTQALSR
jgi:hypothetical protein